MKRLKSEDLSFWTLKLAPDPWHSNSGTNRTMITNNRTELGIQRWASMFILGDLSAKRPMAFSSHTKALSVTRPICNNTTQVRNILTKRLTLVDSSKVPWFRVPSCHDLLVWRVQRGCEASHSKKLLPLLMKPLGLNHGAHPEDSI